LITLEYNQSTVGGPTFPVNKVKVKRLYAWTHELISVEHRSEKMKGSIETFLP